MFEPTALEINNKRSYSGRVETIPGISVEHAAPGIVQQTVNLP